MDYKVTERQKALIAEDFKHVEHCFEEIVVETMIEFLAVPGVKQTFSWADSSISAEEHRDKPGFREHVAAIGKVYVECLGNLENIDLQKSCLERLGSIHNRRNVQFHYYEKMGSRLVSSIQKRLGDRACEESAKAWSQAYDIITYYMIVRFWEGNFGGTSPALFPD